MIDIEVKNLTKTFLQPDSKNKHKYKYLNVLNNLNLEIKNNEVISLIGPSGSGKSTLLNILSGYDSDYQGIININRNIEGKKLSFIFQSHNLLPWLTAVENVKLISNSESLETNRPQKILEELGLKNFINTYPNSLSGGMKRRVSIARAFVNDPNILLMDEPFVSLEKPLANQLRDQTISLIKKNKVTVILVTHDLREAIMFSDRIIFCNETPLKILWEKKIDLQGGRQYDSSIVDKIQKEIMNEQPDILKAVNTNGSRS